MTPTPPPGFAWPSEAAVVEEAASPVLETSGQQGVAGLRAVVEAGTLGAGRELGRKAAQPASCPSTPVVAGVSEGSVLAVATGSSASVVVAESVAWPSLFAAVSLASVATVVVSSVVLVLVAAVASPVLLSAGTVPRSAVAVEVGWAAAPPHLPPVVAD